MCGIAGIISKSKGAVDKWVTSKMLNRISHRGPDDSGIFGIRQNGKVFNIYGNDKIPDDAYLSMGFNRLSIQDLSMLGHQPMISNDGNVIVTFNGEIYNTDELKKELYKKEGKLDFKSTSDTEILLRFYEAFGIDSIRRVNGMFAIALVDFRIRRFFLIRDKFGIIPIHILDINDKFAWSSEIKSFLEIKEFNRKISNVAISRSYLYYNPVDVFFRDVTSVEPGTYVEINIDNPQEISLKKYFSINEWLSAEKYSSIEEAEERYESILKDCVKRQMISDVPVGIQLSGGVDSSSIAYWAAEYSKKIKSFSVISPQNVEFDEKKWIDIVLSKIDVEPYFCSVNQNFFLHNFESSLYAYEKILGVQSQLGIYRFAKEASKNTTVLLSGEGADEICGGYGMASLCYDENFQFTDEFVYGFDRQIIYWENGYEMLNNFDLGNLRQERKIFLDGIDGNNYQKIEALWLKEEIVNLFERQNKTTMASSVENRVPFMDDKMVKFMLSLPIEFIERKATDGTSGSTKYIMKEICKKYYGENFAYRKKQAMNFRISDQINTPKFKDYLETYIFPKMKDRGLVKMDAFNRRFKRMANGQDVLSVWKAINIEVWFQLFVDGRLPILVE